MKVSITTCRNVGNYWPITQRLVIIYLPFKVSNFVRSSKLPYMFRELLVAVQVNKFVYQWLTGNCWRQRISTRSFPTTATLLGTAAYRPGAISHLYPLSLLLHVRAAYWFRRMQVGWLPTAKQLCGTRAFLDQPVVPNLTNIGHSLAHFSFD